MRPLASKRDSSAKSKTLPQRGHLGRLKLSVASSRGVHREDAWYADWTIIVALLRRTPHRLLQAEFNPASVAPARRRRETVMAGGEDLACGPGILGRNVAETGGAQDRAQSLQIESIALYNLL